MWDLEAFEQPCIIQHLPYVVAGSPQREALPLSHMTLELLSETTGVKDRKGHSWEIADAQAASFTPPSPTLAGPVLGGEGVLPKTNLLPGTSLSEQQVAALYMPSLRNGSLFSNCEPSAPYRQAP